MCKNIVEPERPQMTMWRMCVTWWIPNATNTHSEYVTLIALPLQQRLHQRSLLLGYTYIACRLVFCCLPRRRCHRLCRIIKHQRHHSLS
jgi:hypothetical protein